MTMSKNKNGKASDRALDMSCFGVNSTYMGTVARLRAIISYRVLGLMFAATMASTSSALHAGNVTYVYTDPQGTPLAEADSQGNIVDTSDYRPYGRKALGAAEDGPGYTAQVSDADTSLIYMQARYYDEAAGVFLSTDAQGVNAGSIYSFSRFGYAYGNPVALQDPTGMVPTRGSEDGYPFEYYGPGSGMCDSCNVAGVAQAQSTTHGNVNVVDRSVAAGAAADANKALVKALQTTYSSTDELQMAFAKIVQPISEHWDTEIGVKLFNSGPGYRMSSAVSDGVICSGSAICSVSIRDAPDIVGAIFAGYTHTHPNDLGLSESDLYVLSDMRKSYNVLDDVVVYASGPNGRSNKWSTSALRDAHQNSWTDYRKRTTTWVP